MKLGEFTLHQGRSVDHCYGRATPRRDASGESYTNRTSSPTRRPTKTIHLQNFCMDTPLAVT
ncbi:unnamed protein product [Trichogramma brassicae]|uniref:Uncharacterized protein n=1 Tax=Trichogramma brassicae TaxID=86971 RepID=A0A6H5J416_9HYME|nr:unnamed protein product [Trichogramma brassicae]